MTARGFSLLELLIALVLGLTLIAAFLVILQRCRHDFVANESLARLQDSARQAMGVLVSDIEHAGFYGFATAERVRLVAGGATLADTPALAQPDAGSPGVTGLPGGAHDCGANFAVDLRRAVQGADNHYALGVDPRDCAPTASAGGARAGADTLTLRHASRETTAPRAGRLQVYSGAAAPESLMVFADGAVPGPMDATHEVRDVEVRSYYVSEHSVDRRGWPALRVISLTESRGNAQFRDEEVMPGVEDLQVEYAVATIEDGERMVRYVTADSPWMRTADVVAVRLWLRLRADVTEPGFRDARVLAYSNRAFAPGGDDPRHRRLLVERTVALRTPRQP